MLTGVPLSIIEDIEVPPMVMVDGGMEPDMLLVTNAYAHTLGLMVMVGARAVETELVAVTVALPVPVPVTLVLDTRPPVLIVMPAGHAPDVVVQIIDPA